LKVAPRQILDGRFLLLEQIGRGGMSTVFKATDLDRKGALVAVKVPFPQYASGVGSWSMFQREAEIGLRLCHPGIVRFVALSPNKRPGYVVTDYVTGATLAEHMGKGRKFAERDALEMMIELCDAVAYLHAEKLVHYDLKPGNVMLRADGAVTLIDFGMAHQVMSQRFAFGRSAPPMASAEYVAPEQLQRKPGQPSVDIYALGAMLYEMLTGQPPFDGDDPFVVASARQIGDPKAPRELSPSISVQVEEIVLRALRRDPAQRYLTVQALIGDLRQPERVCVSGLAQRLVAVTPWRKRLRLLRAVILVACVPIAAMAAAFRALWWYLEHKGGH
jgi:serine/threonine protein kinase